MPARVGNLGVHGQDLGRLLPRERGARNLATRVVHERRQCRIAAQTPRRRMG